MSKVLTRIGWMVLIALLAVPSAASAGLIDMIWELSGPQLTGLVLIRCQSKSAQIFGCGGGNPFGIQATIDERIWVDYDLAFYWSTGKDAGPQEYEAFKVFLFSLDPKLVVQPIKQANFFTIGAGPMFNLFTGSGFDNFSKKGWKIVPAARFNAGRLGNMEIAYTFRIYADEFVPDDFGPPPHAINVDKPREVVQGMSVTVKF